MGIADRTRLVGGNRLIDVHFVALARVIAHDQGVLQGFFQLPGVFPTRLLEHVVVALLGISLLYQVAVIGGRKHEDRIHGALAHFHGKGTLDTRLPDAHIDDVGGVVGKRKIA